LKKTIKYTLAFILLLIGIFVFQNYPISAEPKPLARLADTNNIKRNLEAIINTPQKRNYRHLEVLDSVAYYIKAEFSKFTKLVTLQPYTVQNQTYSNIIASFGPEAGERIIVGAHYDVCGEQDGADDNASGVAGVLELARLLKADTALKYRIDLVAYTLEEPPFFGTENMGSYVHAKSLYEAKVPVKGMISLEMIGYFSDAANSQHYPVGLLKWFYGSKGNYITLVQKSWAGGFSKQFKKLAFQNNSILTKSFKAPSFVGGIDLSDHRNYWQFGYDALMVTNTSFYRNTNYHKEADVLANLDIPKMGLVVDGVLRVLKAME
jgi:Zn-dependent M28 family amino/carboxypeptidase